MNFIDKMKQRNKDMHSKKVQRAYREIKEDMTIGSAVLQIISMICFLLGVISLAIVIFGAVSLPMIIASMSCMVMSFVTYRAFCALMADRMNKKHQK